MLKHNNISLRKLTVQDIEPLVILANNKKISINLRDGFPHPYTIADAERFIANSMNANPLTTFAINYNNTYAGNIGLVLGSDVYRKSAEIGYFIGEPFWNKGIMSAAVQLIVNYGFKKLNIVRIHTGVFEYNISSQRVLEKCGFKKEGVFEKAIFKEGKIWNEIRYAKTKA